MKRSSRLLTAPRRLLLALCPLLTLAYLVGPANVLGYHFFYVRSGGSQLAARWTNLPVNLLADSTPAGFLADVQTATATWNNVATARNVFGTVTQSATDFTGDNFETAWGNMPAGGDGRHEVVFDGDGSALRELGLKPAEVNGVAPSRKEIVGGQAVIVDSYFVVNGSRTNFDRLSTMIHELGHVQGIAHSSVGMHNSGSAASSALDPIGVGAVPTMHPFSVGGTARRTLEPDDVAALSELYPEPGFATSTGTIEGTVKRCGNEDGVTGANVRAVNTSNSGIQLSRFTGFDGSSDGRFVIRGLPAGSYKLIVEPMGANDFNIASRFGAPPTRQEMDFETEYHNPPQEDECGEELPDTPTNIAVGAGGAAGGKNFRVSGARLAFVVDDTGSMGNEIDAVRTVLSRFVSVLDNLNRTVGTPFPTTTIVTFKDDVTRRVTSNNAARLQQVINSLGASGGGDCPEAANAALLTAGRLLRNGGVVMLFTDANSRPNGPARAEVSQLYRSKSLKSFTLLSGTCEGGIPTPTADAAAAPASCEPMCAAGSANHDEFPLPPTLGNENAVLTFSEISAETGGIFTAIPGIKEGIAVETQRYINSGANIAVSSVVPAVGLVTPGDGPQGTTLNLEIRGSNTNFQSTSAVAFSGGGVTVNSLAVNSPESITANVTVQPGAAPGFRDVTVTTPLGSGTTEAATGSGAFNIVAPPTAPTLLGVSPPQGARGQTLNVSISGANTHFAGGSSVAAFGTGITVNSTVVVSSTLAVANITLAGDAPTGFRDVRVTTGSEVAAENVVGPFLVTAPPPPIPRLVSVGPPQGPRGTTLDVLLTGENVNFVNGVSAASFSGAGITVNSTNVTSPTTATLNITIEPGAALGFRDVFITTGSEVAAILRAFQVTVFSSVQLQASGLTVNEGAGSIGLSVTRAGSAAGEAVVEFATADGSAKGVSDYTTALGSVRFGPGETTKSITVLITDDGFAEGDETLELTLANASGTELGSPGTLTLTIQDNDAAPAATNPLNDARFFVRQHYHDFLNREPDEAGLDFWTQQIIPCASRPTAQARADCFEESKLNVSTAFFLSIEFKQSGHLVFCFYRASFPDGPSRPRGFPRIDEFLRDAQEVGRGVVVGRGDWEALLAANKAAFARRWVERAEFLALHPTSMSAEQYVDSLFANAAATPSPAARAAALTVFGGGGAEGRARALLNVVESGAVNNAQFNASFVMMQYVGYLRRNPNAPPDNDFRGFDFWLQKLNSFSLPAEDVGDGDVALARIRRAEMVKAFLVSLEYMRRFGPEDFSLRR
jgi:hypothetical protein